MLSDELIPWFVLLLISGGIIVAIFLHVLLGKRTYKRQPEEISGARVVLVAPIGTKHSQAAHAKDAISGQALGDIRRIAICQYEGERSFHLFYCDESWDVLSDTRHDSVWKAKERAESEFTGVSENWGSTL